MHSSQDGPAWVLSDIMHTPSPSPVPSPRPAHSPQQNTSTNMQAGPSLLEMPPPAHWTGTNDPQPLNQTELDVIQAKLHEWSLMSPDNSRTVSPRETELIQMIHRLTSHIQTIPDPAQLTVQAETIAGLIQQRDFLLQEWKEDQQRWDAERESWDRVAEALICQRKAATDAFMPDDDTQRHISRLQDDNKALRHKLNIAQQRMLALENELGRIRPLLLSQAFITGPDPVIPEKPPPRRKRKIHEPPPPHPENTDVEMTPTEPGSQSTADSQLASSSQSQSQPHSRPETTQTPTKRLKKTRTPPTHPADPLDPAQIRPTPILADARSEMLLSAARKIGRIRTGVIAGAARPVPAEPELGNGKEKAVEVEGKRRPGRPRGSGKGKQQQQQHAAGSTPDPGTSASATRRTQSFNAIGGASPRTPHRTSTAPDLGSGSGGHNNYPSHLHPSAGASVARPEIVYINPGAVPPVTVPMPIFVPFNPAQAQAGAWPSPMHFAQGTPTHGMMQSTLRTPRSRRGEDDASSGTPGTPFNSLLTAARSMMTDEAFEYLDDSSRPGTAYVGSDAELTPTPSRRRKGANNPVPDDSPIPKRRKFTDAMSGGGSMPASTASTPSRPTRMRSALDVLADQAAQEQERMPSVDTASQRDSAEPQAQYPSESGKSHGKGKGKAQSKGKGKAAEGYSEDTQSNGMRRPPSAPPAPTSPVWTTLVDLREPNRRRNDQSPALRPSTPPNWLPRATSEQPSPSSRRVNEDARTSRYIDDTDIGASEGTDTRRDLGTPRKITVIPVQSGAGLN